MLKRVFYEERIDTLKELNEEQKKMLYQVILNHAGRDYILNDLNQVEIKNGKIIINYKDKSFMDITDIVMPEIKGIGKENAVVKEGILEGEEYGIQR